MITVQVRFFGKTEQFTRSLPAAVQRDLPLVRLPDGASVDDLLRVLQVPAGAERPLVSVNGFYQRDDAVLAEGDRIQLLRTVVGG
jgi:sulfur carrier protein ThiS